MHGRFSCVRLIYAAMTMPATSCRPLFLRLSLVSRRHVLRWLDDCQEVKFSKSDYDAGDRGPMLASRNDTGCSLLLHRPLPSALPAFHRPWRTSVPLGDIDYRDWRGAAKLRCVFSTGDPAFAVGPTIGQWCLTFGEPSRVSGRFLRIEHGAMRTSARFLRIALMPSFPARQVRQRWSFAAT